MSSTNGTVAPPIDPFLYYITIFQCGNCSIGLLLNGFLLYTIFRNPQLRSNGCSVFIMLLTGLDWINDFSLVTTPTILTVSRTTIPLLSCFFIGSYGGYAFYNMTIMMLTISLDRLTSMLVPIKYKFLSQRHKWKYVIAAVVLPAIGLFPFTLYTFYTFSSLQPNTPVYCQPSDYMGADGKNYGFLINVWANVATFLVYFSIFLMIKCRVVKISQDKVDRRISKSLFVLMAITLFFALPAPLFVQYILPTFKIADDQLNNVIYRGVLQLNRFTQSLNGPVLYTCSADYRSAIKKEWAKLSGRDATSVNTGTTQNSPTNRRRAIAVVPNPPINPTTTSPFARGRPIAVISN